MLLAVASHRSSPGATTLALGIAQLAAADDGWRDILLVEADPDGAVLRHLYPQLDPSVTLLTYGIGARRGASAELLDQHSQPLGANPLPRVLVAPDTGPQVSRALDLALEPLTEHAGADDVLVVVDCGRLSNVAATVFHRADRKVLAVRSSTPDVLSLKALYDAYPEQADTIELFLVGEQPYGPADLAEIGMDTAGVLPDDPKTADVLRGVASMPPKKFVKAPLVVAITELLPAAPQLQVAELGSGAAEDVTAPEFTAGDHEVLEPELDETPAAAQVS